MPAAGNRHPACFRGGRPYNAGTGYGAPEATGYRAGARVWAAGKNGGTVDELREELSQWLRGFDALVRAVDFESARDHFTEDAVGFGTYGVMLNGREDLEAGQWRNIWPNIRDFRFRLDQMACGRDGDLAWIAALWDSQGVRPDGSTFDRPGRASFILRREGRRWRAAHSHLSLYPR